MPRSLFFPKQENSKKKIVESFRVLNPKRLCEVFVSQRKRRIHNFIREILFSLLFEISHIKWQAPRCTTAWRKKSTS